MIKVEKIRIQEFRGIRDLTLIFKQKNFAVCGPNGTGKSGIVDALEFALTGNVSRLSGEGTEGISIKEHAPHVDSQKNPEKAIVTLTGFIAKLGKEVTIVRTVKTAANPTVTPNDPDVLAAVKEIGSHPEFALTRRELIRYIIAPAGTRSKEIQVLLHLDRVGEAREVLQKVANAADRATAPLEKQAETHKTLLLQALGIPSFGPGELLKAVNLRRATLGLEPIKELTATTSIREGLATAPAAAKPAPLKISKLQASAEIAELKKLLEKHSAADMAEVRSKATETLEVLAKNEALLRNLTQEGFLKEGIDLIDAKACPFCDREWEIEELRAHVQKKLVQLDEAAKQRRNAELAVGAIVQHLAGLKIAVESVIRQGGLAVPPIDIKALQQFSITVEAARKQLTALVPLADTLVVLTTFVSIPQAALDCIAAVETFVNAIPEPTDQEAAKEYLLRCEERLENYRRSLRDSKKSLEDAILSRQVYETYVKVSTEVLDGIYKLVEKDFQELYRKINPDETKFLAKLTPSLGKLSFEVDFYNRGVFPPGAYHSEGHQDGMGLCLYLALMRHILRDNFVFAVLDDVLMSVDAGHRREVCNLLKTEFPKTQFILTTHDEVWLRHMNTVGLIDSKARVHFRIWDVDHGPTEWDDRDVWEEIDDHLAKNNVPAAAGLLRNYLEYASAEFCHRLRAPVEYRGDAQMQLGELLPPAIGKLKDLYKTGKKSANSWGKKDLVTALNAQEEILSAATVKSNAEQWQVNKAIHYNEWATFQKADFAPVAQAFKELLECFRCPTCKATVYAVPDRGTKPGILRCDCGSISINLLDKQKD